MIRQWHVACGTSRVPQAILHLNITVLALDALDL